jgi:hypothetical protein
MQFDHATGPYLVFATEVGKQPRYDFCPTRIDIYGGVNVQLVGCGGSQRIPVPVENGYFSPGSPGYDSTVAGRLLARLSDDPDLVPIFGTTWTVRSCAGPGETLSRLAPLSEGACAPDPSDDPWLGVCKNDPAPILLFAAGMTDDACHGGEQDAKPTDDLASYLQHYAQRMDAFLASRNPSLAILGPSTEWTAAPVADEAGCQWQRPDWDEVGLQHWLAGLADSQTSVVPVADLHDDFRAHNKCCANLGFSCSTNWLVRDPGNPEMVNCDGAQAIVDFWYSRLKETLLAREFLCP